MCSVSSTMIRLGVLADSRARSRRTEGVWPSIYSHAERFGQPGKRDNAVDRKEFKGTTKAD